MQDRQFIAALRCLFAAAIILSSLGFAQSQPVSTQPADIGALAPASGSAQRQAAEIGLAKLIERWSAPASIRSARRIFNIADEQELQRATIGDGFEMYLVDPTILLSGKRLDQSVYGSGEWRFVIMANGKGIGLVTVALMQGKWTVVEFGASELAGEIASVAKRYAQQAPGARLRFLRSPQAVADFIEVLSPSVAPASGAPVSPVSPVYVPLASARATFASHEANAVAPASALTDAELDDRLRQRVGRGMRDPRFGH
jgi:hypothetical protein